MTPEQLKALMAWVDARVLERNTSCLLATKHEGDARTEMYTQFGFTEDLSTGDPVEGPKCDCCGRELINGSCAICNPYDPFDCYEVVSHPIRRHGYAIRNTQDGAYLPCNDVPRYWTEEKDARKFIRGLG